jgi:NADH-ubiquinone oxidoreductase chain 3|uniref:NADH-ubiquinone oxidoreductase chain 3 n=1 Tax=Ophiostoma novo-ulmi subsp. novo-ulmi TaxID=170179 RepID=A0A2L1IPU5_OPHNO|nr:NADH dehydrogenase subunit 3 [Ophiostoma novo-ulmi subsp. novo-ulmi]UGY85931.1 NADH dehydrogenase subunit 3 [Ophiostoma himal-ulmi]
MSSLSILFVVVIIIAILFLAINLIFAPHNPYQEKYSIFECGFHSFLQSRQPFNIAFFIYALLFLLFDLEILLLFPYSVSSYTNDIYGLIIVIIFTVLVTVGFIFEVGKGALKIESNQVLSTDLKMKNMNLIITSIFNKTS